MLAVEGRRTREQLAALLWPESDETRARGALRRTLSVLGSGVGGTWLHTDRQSIDLDPAATVDVRRGDELARELASHAHTGAACSPCRQLLDELVPLHRGPFLDGFALRDTAEFDVWRSEEAERRRRQLLRALERKTDLEVADGDLDAALTTLHRWREEEPLNEQVHRRLIGLHGRRGERLAAVHVYRECVAVLERELGVAPLDATTRLYQAILDGHVTPSPARPPRPVAPVPAGRDRTAATTRAPRELPMVGREDDLERAAAHLERAGGAVVVRGEAGIGKSRFLEELEARLHRLGVDVLTGRCHRGEEALAFGPVVELLRDRMRRPDATTRLAELAPWQLAELSRLLPELASPVAPPAGDGGEARLRFLGALAAALDTLSAPPGRPAVLLLEDIHLADAGTRDLLVFLARRLEQWRLRMVVTRRGGDHAPRDRWEDGSLGDRLLAIDLQRLTEAQVLQLCTSALGPAGDAVAPRLQRETDGLPLAVVQYLDWLGDGAGAPDEPWPLPTGLREVVGDRLADLDETVGQVAAAIAVIGHGVDLPLLVTVSGRSEDETARALDDLLERGVATAGRDGTFELAHEWLRSVAYDACSPARRRLLHARVVTALTTRAGRRGGGRLAARIAEHARAAGLRHEAATWSVRAGDHALTVFANEDALEHFESALALEPDAPATIHGRIARIHVLAGDYDAARASYETAAALADDDAELTAIEHELGALHLRRREWEAARLHLEAALAGSHASDVGRTARIRADVGLVALQRGDLEEAEAHALVALRDAETVEDREALAQARNLAGMIARRRGDHAGARRHLEHAAALAVHLRDPSAYIAALNNLALTTVEAGDPDRAHELLCTALTRCTQQGDRHRQAALLNNLADLHHRRGDEELAQERLVEAVALFHSIGGDDRDSAPDPEIWKLVEW